MTQKIRNIIKRTILVIVSLIITIVLLLGGYIIYLCAQYYRIEDNQPITTTGNLAKKLSLGANYTITTYNIGFGAYTQDFSFFMDTGVMKNTGEKIQGTGSRANSKESVIDCVNGASKVISEFDADIMLFQEVDTRADRSYFVNQYSMLNEKFSNYGTNFASNFHSGYLFYPITNPHGSVDAGIATYSKYNIATSERRSFPIDESFPNKFFDLDRCFVVNKMPIEGSDKYLILINLHMSAYDEGGVYRALQLKLLFDYVSKEYAEGNYVIAGGDWNHDIANSRELFKSDEKIPDWVRVIDQDELPAGFRFSASTKTSAGTLCPTCRSSDMPYTKKDDGTLVNYSVVLDGFLISDNVSAIQNANIDTEFKYSDHNPAMMKFQLKSLTS